RQISKGSFNFERQSDQSFFQKSKKGYYKKTYSKNSVQKNIRKPSVKIAFLGGLNEIGKNITLIECGNDMIVVDCGMAFPDGDMLGVDLVIPDFSYLEQNQDKIRGIILTHGHEDHIGGLPYLLSKIKVPIYG